jgi:hypothetical protein
LVLALTPLLAHAQATATTFVQTYRRGPTGITPFATTVRLSSANRSFETKVRDSAGNPRFRLSIVPQLGSDSDPRVSSWNVWLVDQRRRYLGNLLRASDPAGPLSGSAEDNAWRLDANPYAVVLLTARRIFKVDNFYLTVQARNPHSPDLNRYLMDSLEVDVSFTRNRPPGDEN